MKKICGLLAALALFVATPARADEIKVMTSGAFTEAYQQLVEQFQKATATHGGHDVRGVDGWGAGLDPSSARSR